MSSRNKANLAVIAAIFVLFSALIDARISAIIAFAALIALAVYEYRSKD